MKPQSTTTSACVAALALGACVHGGSQAPPERRPSTLRTCRPPRGSPQSRGCGSAPTTRGRSRNRPLPALAAERVRLLRDRRLVLDAAPRRGDDRLPQGDRLAVRVCRQLRLADGARAAGRHGDDVEPEPRRARRPGRARAPRPRPGRVGARAGLCDRVLRGARPRRDERAPIVDGATSVTVIAAGRAAAREILLQDAANNLALLRVRREGADPAPLRARRASPSATPWPSAPARACTRSATRSPRCSRSTSRYPRGS